MSYPNCSELKGFHNNFNTCWNIVAQSILFYNIDTRQQIIETLLIEGMNYNGHAECLVRRAKEDIKFLLPDYFGPTYYDKVESDIIRMFAILIERFNIKYKSSDSSAPLSLILRREETSVCEHNFSAMFFNIFELNQYSADGSSKAHPHEEEAPPNYTSTIYETFFIFNLLSVVLLNNNGKPRLFNFKEQNITTPFIEDESIGSIIWVPDHVIGIFKCDNYDYKYVDNNFITRFNFLKLIKRQNEGNYQLNYHPHDGIYISIPKRRPNFFSKKNPDPYSSSGESLLVLNIYNVYEHIGYREQFKSSHELTKLFYSPTYRLFIDITKNNVERVREIYSNFSSVIDYEYIDYSDNTVFSTALKYGRFEIAEIMIENMKNYDDAIWYIYTLYNGNPKFLKLLELLLEESKDKELDIDHILMDVPVRQENIDKILDKFKKTNAPSGSVTHSSATGGDHYKKYIKYANAKSIEPSFLKYVGSEAHNLDDIFYKKYIMYKQKYLNLKNRKI
jgi:hypothetical protein